MGQHEIVHKYINTYYSVNKQPSFFKAAAVGTFSVFPYKFATMANKNTHNADPVSQNNPADRALSALCAKNPDLPMNDTDT